MPPRALLTEYPECDEAEILVKGCNFPYIRRYIGEETCSETYAEVIDPTPEIISKADPGPLALASELPLASPLPNIASGEGGNATFPLGWRSSLVPALPPLPVTRHKLLHLITCWSPSLLAISAFPQPTRTHVQSTGL